MGKDVLMNKKIPSTQYFQFKAENYVTFTIYIRSKAVNFSNIICALLSSSWWDLFRVIVADDPFIVIFRRKLVFEHSDAGRNDKEIVLKIIGTFKRTFISTLSSHRYRFRSQIFKVSIDRPVLYEIFMTI